MYDADRYQRQSFQDTFSIEAESSILDLPYLTTDHPGLGGQIRTVDSDFIVEEIPLYPPSGRGSHLFVLLEKRGIGTREAIAALAQHLNIPRHRIGFAGLKDAHAIARQWLSFERVDFNSLHRFRRKGLKIIQIERHDNKIKLGHLAGNRFTIRLRRLRFSLKRAASRAESVISLLTHRGVPNYFGPQRFGNRLDNHLLGEALIHNQIDHFMDLLLGHPGPLDSPPVARARALYDQGDYRKAHRAWPYLFADHRQALHQLMINGGRKRKACHAVSASLKNFYVSAWQSLIFNRVLATRMPQIDQLLTGDLAWIHNTADVFLVKNATREQPRCDRFEISPTGPLPGPRMSSPSGPAAEIENAILQQAVIGPPEFDLLNKFDARTGRRPLRIPIHQPEISSGRDHHGDFLQLQFTLDPGSYATAVIRELTKSTR